MSSGEQGFEAEHPEARRRRRFLDRLPVPRPLSSGTAEMNASADARSHFLSGVRLGSRAPAPAFLLPVVIVIILLLAEAGSF